MARKQEPIRPFYTVKHEYEASAKAYHDAAMMLHSAVTALLNIAQQNPKVAFPGIDTLREHAENYRRIAFGDKE